jgi:hypothetical protein
MLPGGLIYIDLHAHAVRQGCFIFGNGPLKTAEDQLSNQLLPRLIALNCLNFDYVECSFSMNTNDDKKEDAQANIEFNKEGCGRVCFY